MDISKLSHGAKLVLGGTIAFLIVSFFNWQEVELGQFGSAGVSMWHGVGVIAGLLAIGLLVWEALRLVNIDVALPVGPAMTSAALAILLGFFTVIKFLVDNEFRTFWAWLGLLLAILIVVGAVMNMQAAGESVASVKDQIAAATGGGAAAAAPAAPAAAEATPAAPAAPAETAPAPAVETASEIADTAAEPAGDLAADAAPDAAPDAAFDAADGPDAP